MKDRRLATTGLTLGPGALAALDRDDRRQWALLAAAVDRGFRPTIPAPVLTRAFQDARQPRLHVLLRHCRIEATDAELALEAAALCAVAGTHDVVQAVLVASAARRRDSILTSEATTVAHLAAHVSGVAVIPTRRPSASGARTGRAAAVPGTRAPRGS